MDQHSGAPSGLEDYFSPGPPVANAPAVPTPDEVGGWSAATQLQPADPISLSSEASLTFAPAPAPPPPPLVPPVPAPSVGSEATAVPGVAPPLAPPAPPPAPVASPPAGEAPTGADPSPPPPGNALEAGPSTVRIGAEDTSADSALLADLLLEVLERGASDLHLTAGAPPTIRMHGHLEPVEGRETLTPTVLQQVLYAILTQKQRERFEEVLELDFAYSLPGRARFRVNLYKQRESIGAAFRLIPYEIKRLEDLGVPMSVANFAMLPRGFVLVTGPTGSGKSTTLAAVIDQANRQRREHIMTVEDPIEFLHDHQQCLVNQREVGEDTHNFQNALKHVLRQDPDIILVGEMRDLETISVALTAAETGHLVFATLHTQDAAQTIDRVIDVFPPHQQQQVRVQLAGSLQGVVCQQLLRTSDGTGRVVATEVLIATPAVRNLIREGKTHQIYSAMQAGAKFGMATMDQHLAELVKKGVVVYDAALEKCHHVEDFNRLCGRA